MKLTQREIELLSSYLPGMQSADGIRRAAAIGRVDS